MMETLGLAASVIAIVTFAWSVGIWLFRKCSRTRRDTIPSNQPLQNHTKSKSPLEMPLQAKDPTKREAMRQLYVQTHGKPATRAEVDHMLAGSIIVSGVDHVTDQDLAELETNHKAEPPAAPYAKPADGFHKGEL
jgi:hypothetical protein